MQKQFLSPWAVKREMLTQQDSFTQSKGCSPKARIKTGIYRQMSEKQKTDFQYKQKPNKKIICRKVSPKARRYQSCQLTNNTQKKLQNYRQSNNKIILKGQFNKLQENSVVFKKLITQQDDYPKRIKSKDDHLMKWSRYKRMDQIQIKDKSILINEKILDIIRQIQSVKFQKLKRKDKEKVQFQILTNISPTNNYRWKENKWFKL